MKSFLELAAARQSDRVFVPGKRIEREVLERIVEAARLAPSACNGQPWHFTVVTTEPEPDAARKNHDCRFSQSCFAGNG